MRFCNGDLEKAQEEVRAIQDVNPDTTIEQIKKPPLQDKDSMKRFVGALKKAGFPK